MTELPEAPNRDEIWRENEGRCSYQRLYVHQSDQGVMVAFDSFSDFDGEDDGTLSYSADMHLDDYLAGMHQLRASGTAVVPLFRHRQDPDNGRIAFERREGGIWLDIRDSVKNPYAAGSDSNYHDAAFFRRCAVDDLLRIPKIG